MSDWLTELQAKRQQFVDAVRSNNFDDGVRQSAVEKYADPVHFVYELIQNAEDQEASLARFSLKDDLITFEHNGKAFSQGDVERITGWGQSDKINQANKIGRFGIGFKSVFVITESPEVYIRCGSDEKLRSFRIRDLFVPEAFQEDSCYSIPKEHDCSTRFVLRFKKTNSKRFATLIRERFESFSADVLLFLSHLKKVEWKTEAASGVCERFDRDGIRRIETTSNYAKDQQRKSLNRYLVFERSVSVPRAERQQTVKLAFLLDKDRQIIAEDPQPPIHVFFPTQERLGLKFRLHAPFLLTDNRANIKQGVPENEELVKECAKLLIEAVGEIRDRNKLTVRFLGILPFDRAAFPPHSMLAPLFDKVFECFYEDEVLPCGDDSFCRWKQARFTKDLRLMNLVPDNYLTNIAGEGRALRWLHKDFGRSDCNALFDFLDRGIKNELSHRRPNDWWKFSSHQVEIEWSTAVGKFTKSFLEERSDTWIAELYLYLNNQDTSKFKLLRGDLFRCPIIRLNSGVHVSPFRDDLKPQAFLPTADANDYPTVRASVIQTEAALSFVKKIGIDVPDLGARITEVILPKYKPLASTVVSLEDHLKDVELVVGFLNETSGTSFTHVLKAVDQTAFFYARNAASCEKCKFLLKANVYIRSEDLECYFHGNKDAWFLHECYTPWDQSIKDYFKISDVLGVEFRKPSPTGHVTLVSEHGYHKRGLKGFDPEAKVDGLKHALLTPSLPKARIIWNQVLDRFSSLIKGQVETSTRQDYSGARREQRVSIFGELLLLLAWLPKTGGGWCKPNDLSLDDLPEDFARNHELVSQLGMKQSFITALASEKNMSPRFIQDLLAAAESDPEKAQQFLRDCKSTQKTESEIYNETRNVSKSLSLSPSEKLASAFLAPGKTALDDTPKDDGVLKNPERYRRELGEQLRQRRESERPRDQRQCLKLRRVWEDANPQVREFLLQTYGGKCQISNLTSLRPDRRGR